MPFAAVRRHQFWSIDVRYLEDHALGTGKPVYVISILENFSQPLLASTVSRRQDLTAPNPEQPLLPNSVTLTDALLPVAVQDGRAIADDPNASGGKRATDYREGDARCTHESQAICRFKTIDAETCSPASSVCASSKTPVGPATRQLREPPSRAWPSPCPMPTISLRPSPPLPSV
jgi:hypothetical protein